MSFRRRLVLSSVLAVGLTALLLSGVVFLVVRALLYRQTDDQLRNAARVAALAPDPERVAGVAMGPLRLESPRTPDAAPALFTVRIAAGVLPAAGVRGERLGEVRDHVPDVGDEAAFTTRSAGASVRMFARRLADGSVVLVATPIGDLQRTLRLLLLILAGLVALALVASVAGARFASRATLAPVRRLTGTAEEIAATRDLAHRVSAGPGDDELARMAGAFNLMLSALERSQAAQRALVADASHELRTPLTALRTNMDTFLADGLSAADREAMRRDLAAGLRELSALVDDLVEAARDEPPLAAERDGLDLADVVATAVDDARRRHPTATFAPPELEPTPLVGDAHRLGRAVANLLDNAARHAPPNSAVEVTLRDGVLTVRDHGSGIAEEDREHVFDRFYRAVGARAHPGNGLGLAIVRAVAEGHGGRVRAESPADGGARLVLDLSVSPLRRTAISSVMP